MEASNGFEALKIASEYEGKIHLIVTDVMMPKMRGEVLVSNLKEIHPDIKQLFVSGYADNAIVPHGMLQADMAFLQKPFTFEGLLKKVREALTA